MMSSAAQAAIESRNEGMTKGLASLHREVSVKPCVPTCYLSPRPSTPRCRWTSTGSRHDVVVRFNQAQNTALECKIGRRTDLLLADGWRCLENRAIAVDTLKPRCARDYDEAKAVINAIDQPRS